MRLEGTPASCDLCGAVNESVDTIVHRDMVEHVPYARDACAACARELARRFVREGNRPYLARASDDDATHGESSASGVEGSSRDW